MDETYYKLFLKIHVVYNLYNRKDAYKNLDKLYLYVCGGVFIHGDSKNLKWQIQNLQMHVIPIGIKCIWSIKTTALKYKNYSSWHTFTIEENVKYFIHYYWKQQHISDKNICIMRI